MLRKLINKRPCLPSPSERRCYGCGCTGHLRGDPECSAKDKAVWKGAPERFKRKVEKYDQSLLDRGAGQGVSEWEGHSIGKRGKAAPKVPCRNWLWGNGTCKYAERCRYSHDAYAGSGADFNNARVISAGARQRKDKYAPVIITELNEIKEGDDVFVKSAWWKDDSDDEGNLYQLVRGAPAVIVRSEATTINNDFIQKKGNLIEPKGNLIGSKIPKTDKRRFFIGILALVFCLRMKKCRICRKRSLRCLWMGISAAIVSLWLPFQ